MINGFRVYDADAKAEVFMKAHIGGCDFLQ